MCFRQNQGILIETMQQENSKFEEVQVLKDLANVVRIRVREHFNYETSITHIKEFYNMHNFQIMFQIIGIL